MIAPVPGRGVWGAASAPALVIDSKPLLSDAPSILVSTIFELP